MNVDIPDVDDLSELDFRKPETDTESLTGENRKSARGRTEEIISKSLYRFVGTQDTILQEEKDDLLSQVKHLMFVYVGVWIIGMVGAMAVYLVLSIPVWLSPYTGNDLELVINLVILTVISVVHYSIIRSGLAGSIVLGFMIVAYILFVTSVSGGQLSLLPLSMIVVSAIVALIVEWADFTAFKTKD